MKIYVTIAALFFCSIVSAKGYTFELNLTDSTPTLTFTVKTSQGKPPLNIDKDGNVTDSLPEKINTLYFSCTSSGQDSVKFYVYVAGIEAGGFLGSEKDKAVSSAQKPDLTGQVIQIKLNKKKPPVFTFTMPGTPTPTTHQDKKEPVLKNDKTAKDVVRSYFPTLLTTTFGLEIPNGNTYTVFTGEKYSHIFLDQYGNNIFTTIPQGVSNRQYIIHIFYLLDSSSPNDIIYSVNQLEGEFQDALVFNNANQLGTVDFHSAKEASAVWAHREFLLSTSTTDIKFEVVRTSPKVDDPNQADNVTVKTYSIKMSKLYHGSFDVGLISTSLENPGFQLLASANDPNTKVVKKTGGGRRGVVTAMASFYASPIVILESLLGLKQYPSYKLTGRNFLDDHAIYERIYPTVGVGFTDKTLENLFYGFNWEFARGGALFVGWHYGKVNTYDGGDGFTYEQTPVTDAEFALKQNTVWKTGFAVGLKLDIMIIRNLFGSTGAATAPAGN